MAKESSFERTVLLRAALMAAPGVVLACVAVPFAVGWAGWIKILTILSTFAATAFFIRRFVQQLFYPINSSTVGWQNCKAPA